MDRERMKEGFLHIFKAAGYSLAGLKTGLRLSLAFRQETGILILLVILLAAFQKPVTTWLVAVGAWLLVMMAELINTAIEETLNLITKDYNIGVNNAKDRASAAVFRLLAVTAALWFCMFILRLF